MQRCTAVQHDSFPQKDSFSIEVIDFPYVGRRAMCPDYNFPTISTCTESPLIIEEAMASILLRPILVFTGSTKMGSHLRCMKGDAFHLSPGIIMFSAWCLLV
ncbi:hypothetical protein AVEN_18248-1 [Araneus ventricosus]|uniref:Uncharacterized protein n=1 Tax=Araneus ventricosus TaxID=182803 RepID=A0A4Y2AKJ0_ARAVE|nr:hypothetical protein AVEN_18248-1 [Araneus ventricosus]